MNYLVIHMLLKVVTMLQNIVTGITVAFHLITVFDNFPVKSKKIFQNDIKNVEILMGRTRFERVIPAMSRRYPNQARPPALPSLSLLLFL